MNIVVPFDRLQPETLRALIEEFLTRDGAVHGHTDALLSNQVEAVRDQLKSGKVVITFDDETESCTICSAHEVRRALEDDADAIGHDAGPESEMPPHPS